MSSGIKLAAVACLALLISLLFFAIPGISMIPNVVNVNAYRRSAKPLLSGTKNTVNAAFELSQRMID